MGPAVAVARMCVGALRFLRNYPTEEPRIKADSCENYKQKRAALQAAASATASNHGHIMVSELSQETAQLARLVFRDRRLARTKRSRRRCKRC